MSLYVSWRYIDPCVILHLNTVSFSDLPGVEVTSLTRVPLVFLDTAGCDMTELDTPSEESKGNEGLSVTSV